MRSFQTGEIEVFVGSGVLANHLEKFECTGVTGSLARAQRPEFLADGPVLKAPGYGDEDARRMAAERRRKVDFLVSGKRAVAESGAPKCVTSCAASISTAARRSVSLASTICASVERPSELQAQKTGAKCGTRFALQICRIRPTECEGARHRPFARFCRFFKNKRIRCIELDGT